MARKSIDEFTKLRDKLTRARNKVASEAKKAGF